MSVKTVTIKDEVYKLISNIKRENESFSDVLLRVVRKKTDIMDFYGTLNESKALEDMRREILKERKKSTVRDVLL